ncbi:HAUS augmin-like complex subunit 6 [Indicator indicator]|uniref:HAUS augmin-like complex subunit 6 n=1 Tax=Indicator indicator TaxID=1002788 RepID=UPI0023DF564A|nr:HAUS augmin-like complex subunit 6 [Indicator indicator]
MVTPWKRNHPWLYVRGLGFDPQTDGKQFKQGALCIRQTFNRPNRSAYDILAHFMFTKLDPSRAEEAFRDCYLPGHGFENIEFRNKCCEWLKDIAVKESHFPKITRSSLVAANHPRLTDLFYHFARHVMLKDLEANSVGVDTPFAEAVKARPEDVHMAKARRRVAYNKLLQFFQQQEFIRQEYKQKAQLLIEEIEQIKSEHEALQIQSCNTKQNHANRSSETERIQKVRSMWTSVMETLTSLKKEELVASVLEDRLDQCVLDGNVVFGIPQLLFHRVEGDVHQCCTRNVYEGKKLNFLAVILLLNEALRALRDEHCQSELKQFQAIERIVTFYKKGNETLNARRLEMEHHSVSASASVTRNQEDWEVKWKSFLGLHPFDVIADQDLELGLLRSSPPCSFDLPEEREEHSIFCQHLASASDIFDSVHEICYEKDDGALETVMDKPTPSLKRLSSMPLELSEVSENNEVFIEKNLHIGTCKGEKMPVPPKTVQNEKDESSTSEAQEDGGDHIIQTQSPVKKDDFVEKARDELAEEVAKTVMSDLPQSDGKGMSLDDLINSLSSIPFLTRKQIPRTPENLLTETRSSWRKAIQTEGSSEMQLAPAQVMIEEAPMDATPIMKKVADPRFTCLIPASPVPDFDPPLLEKTSQLSSAEFRPQEQVRINDTAESPVLETSGEQKSERNEAQELTYTVLKESSLEDAEKETLQYVKKSTYPPAVLSENNTRTNVLLSDPIQGSLADGTLCQNASSLRSSFSHEAGCLGILDETLLEELDSIDLNETTSSQWDVDEADSACATSGSENKGDNKKSTLNLQSLFNTQKALEKPAANSEEEVHQTNNEGESVNCGSDRSLAPEGMQEDEFSSCQKVLCLHEEFTKTPSSGSMENRKYSLSSLQVACEDLAEMASVVHRLPTEVVHKLKDKEQLDEQLSRKDPSSEYNFKAEA